MINLQAYLSTYIFPSITGYQLEKPPPKCQGRNLKIDTSPVPKTIEEYEIQQEKEFSQALLDGRTEAVYEIKYRQAVTPEDIYLQIGAKSPATASCEDMILSVHLPGEVFTALELDVTKTEINLSGFSHKLLLQLPHPIDPDLSKASWNQDDEKLSLILRMTREFDYVNF